MPSPYISKLSKETGKPEREIEKLWKKAKEIASEEFGKDEDDFGNREYKYTTGVVKKILGVDESILDPSLFLESEYSAKDYIETVVSGNFSIGNVRPPEEEDEYEEEKECNEETGEGCRDKDEEYYVEESAAKFTPEELVEIEKESAEEIQESDAEDDDVPEDLVSQLDRIIKEEV